MKFGIFFELSTPRPFSAADGEHLRAWIEQPGSQFE